MEARGARHSAAGMASNTGVNCPIQMLVVAFLGQNFGTETSKEPVGWDRNEVNRIRVAWTFLKLLGCGGFDFSSMTSCYPLCAMGPATVCFVSLFTGVCGEVAGILLVLYWSPPTVFP